MLVRRRIMKNKVLSLLIATALSIALLSGCGNASGTAEEPAAQQESEPADTAGAEETPAAETDESDEYAAGFDPSDVYTPEEHHMKTYIEGCDTFTQIIDKEENRGMAYANVHIGDTDVLLVASGTYEYEPDGYAAIDSEIFYYGDNGPEYMDYVQAGGTAYPLMVINDTLYIGGNHFMIKYTIRDNALVVSEEAYVEYDTDGNATYYYRTEDTSFADHTPEEAEAKFGDLFGEMDENGIVWFSNIGGDDNAESGSLPRYEYPDDDPYCNAITDYFLDEIAPQYAEADLSVPQIAEIDVDESDPEDVKVWGNFQIWNYDLEGDVLKTVSGGTYSGLIHLKKTDERTAVVTSFDEVGDGSDFDASARKIFGDRYDRFMEVYSDEESRELFRKNILIEYVESNGLNITAYQDYGWDPVTLF